MKSKAKFIDSEGQSPVTTDWQRNTHQITFGSRSHQTMNVKPSTRVTGCTERWQLHVRQYQTITCQDVMTGNEYL